MRLIDAAKAALELLEYGNEIDAITALRAAIEAAEKQEPVAWLNKKISYMSVLTKPDDGGGWFPVFTTPQPAIPEGWQLVPVEPTEAMLDAGEMIDGDGVTYVDLFKAMLAAAPKPENSHE